MTEFSLPLQLHTRAYFPWSELLTGQKECYGNV